MTARQRHFAWMFYVTCTWITLLAFVALGVAEAYVRWKFNQTFTFLGDFGFPSLAILLAAELLGFAHLLRSKD